MQNTLILMHLVVAALYATALWLYVGDYLRGDRCAGGAADAGAGSGGGSGGGWRAIPIPLLAAVHALLLVGVGWSYREVPLVNAYNVFSFLALSLLVVYQALEWRFRVKTTGAFILAVAFVLHGASWPQLGVRPELIPRLQDPWFAAHVILAIMGYTAFIVSAIYGVLYLALYRSLKRRTFGLIFQRLPALDLLSRMNAHAALFGLGCLSVAIGLGMALARNVEASFYRDPTFLQSLLTWVVYGGFALAYYPLRWRGTRQVYVSLAGFAVAVGSMTVVLILFRTFHPAG